MEVRVDVELEVGVVLDPAAGLRVAVGDPACAGVVLTGVGIDLVAVAPPGVRVADTAVPVTAGGVTLPGSVGVVLGGGGTVGGGPVSAAGKKRLISRP